ncbi:hypothetical protein [Macrococcoides caseolyticum]|uniref:hypothetical protein n=1 Tax=Macrococcoides caseolyticum TaxID=69966 RepID=UPI001F2DB0CC|nr:hypothetical protein [Macrococcus caseolyticus]MCE4957267.1 hypothetical protein [Macrococcus caseolyticus]
MSETLPTNFTHTLTALIAEAGHSYKNIMIDSTSLQPIFKQLNLIENISFDLKSYTTEIASIMNNINIHASLSNAINQHTKTTQANKKLLYINSLINKVEQYYPEVDIFDLSVEEIETLVHNYEYTTEFLLLDNLQLTLFSIQNSIQEIPNSISNRINTVNSIIDNKIGRNKKYIIFESSNELLSYLIENQVNEYFQNSTAALMLKLYFVLLLFLYRNTKPKEDIDK